MKIQGVTIKTPSDLGWGLCGFIKRRKWTNIGRYLPQGYSRPKGYPQPCLEQSKCG